MRRAARQNRQQVLGEGSKIRELLHLRLTLAAAADSLRPASGRSAICQRDSIAFRTAGGAPAIFTPEQICQIMALACEDPERLDVPISQWSQSELARQAVSRGIVKSISHGSVGRFLKRSEPPAASPPLLADAQA